MLTKMGPKLLDFGLAKLRPIGQPVIAGMSSPPTVTTPLTGQGASKDTASPVPNALDFFVFGQGPKTSVNAQQEL